MCQTLSNPRASPHSPCFSPPSAALPSPDASNTWRIFFFSYAETDYILPWAAYDVDNTRGFNGHTVNNLDTDMEEISWILIVTSIGTLKVISSKAVWFHQTGAISKHIMTHNREESNTLVACSIEGLATTHLFFFDFKGAVCHPFFGWLIFTAGHQMRACIENILLKHFKGRTFSMLGSEREHAREGLRGQKEHLDFDGLISYIFTYSLQNAERAEGANDVHRRGCRRALLNFA